MTLPQAILATWRFVPEAGSCSSIFPDGCRDLILRVSADGYTPSWFVSDLADTLLQVESHAREQYLGFRFHPGAVIDVQAMLTALGGIGGIDGIGGIGDIGDVDSPDVLSIIAEQVHIESRVAEALASLAMANSVGAARRQLGVSERSLERLLREHTSRTPAYWKCLARVRRVALALSGNAPLAEIAIAHGYADQAHMSRELKRWFGYTPSQLRNAPALLALATESGYR